MSPSFTTPGYVLSITGRLTTGSRRHAQLFPDDGRVGPHEFGHGRLLMGTVMQRENERGRLMVPASSTELSTRIERQSGGLAAAGQ